jgi:uncharacterized protein YjaG (DUF416 family)
MDDRSILQRIGELADEERALEEAHVGQALPKDELDHLQKIEVELDQCWDLLRQRRARRSVGRDSDGAAVRSEEVVERYQQ